MKNIDITLRFQTTDEVSAEGLVADVRTVVANRLATLPWRSARFYTELLDERDDDTYEEDVPS